MHRDVHRFLDGELPRTALSREAAAELAEWETIESGAVERSSDRAPPWFANDVMRALPAPRVAPWRRAWEWLITPRPVRVPPFAPIAAASALVLAFLALPPRSPGPLSVATSSSAATAVEPLIYVQFTLIADGAQSVAVAGDFNNWSTGGNVLRDPDGDGAWSGLVAVQPGVHKYMFVVDGVEWVTDPVAERYVDDGFGMRNALLSVARPLAAS